MRFIFILFLTLSLISDVNAQIKRRPPLQKTYDPVDPNDVRILKYYEAPPPTVEYRGNIITTKGSYKKAITDAKKKVGEVGARYIIVTAIVPPDYSEGRISWNVGGKVYCIDPKDLMDSNKYINNDIQDIPANANYSLIYFYWPEAGHLFGGKAKIYIDDSLLYKVHYKAFDTIKIYHKDLHKFSLQYRGKKYEVPINFQHGETYYVRYTCDLMTGDKTLYLVDRRTGKREFNFHKFNKDF